MRRYWSEHSLKDWQKRAGSSAAMRGSIIDGMKANPEAARAYAAELLTLTPDIILASGTVGTIALKQLTRAVPIVFANVADPVGSGIVDNLARPGGNITGFMLYEFSIGGKYLDLLREIAPHTTRVAVFRDDTNTASVAIFSVIQAMATSVGLQVRPVNQQRRNCQRRRGLCS